MPCLWGKRLMPYRINEINRQSDIAGKSQRDQRQQHDTDDAQRSPSAQKFADQHEADHRGHEQPNGDIQRYTVASFSSP